MLSSHAPQNIHQTPYERGVLEAELRWMCKLVSELPMLCTPLCERACFGGRPCRQIRHLCSQRILEEEKNAPSRHLDCCWVCTDGKKSMESLFNPCKHNANKKRTHRLLHTWIAVGGVLTVSTLSPLQRTCMLVPVDSECTACLCNLLCCCASDASHIESPHSAPSSARAC